MSTAKMAEYLENTEEWDPITPQLIQSIFKNDSRAMESLGKRWNIQPLEDEARYNQQNPEEGIANASKATASAFLGNWLGGAAGLMGGASGGAGGAVPPMAEMGGQTAMQVASQMQNGGTAAGLLGTMEAGLTDTGYTPSSLGNLLQNGPNSGNFGQSAFNYGRQSLGNMSPAQKRMMMNQGRSLMEPQAPMAPQPQQPRPQQPQPMIAPYMTEEEKRRLMMMQMGIYQ